MRYFKQMSAIGLATIITCSLLTLACSSSSEAADVLTDYLKQRGVKEVQVDLFEASPNTNDKAYISATIVHNFATAEGKPQKEYVGYILAKADGKWTVQERTKYTTEKDKALVYLSGGK